MCTRYKLDFASLGATYGLYQNTNDTFRGETIAILYDPGNFPALFEQSSTKKLYRRNGGVPQAGNLSDHLEVFRRHMDELVVDRNFAGNTVLIILMGWRIGCFEVHF